MPLRRPRMYWACTHVTLRMTEVPLLLEAGFEVVPEEVNIEALNYKESLDYDNPSSPFYPNWEDGCTLGISERIFARRSRLSQRRGVFSEEEQLFFNANFDVIYLATDLSTAITIASWFKGTVIYRYFGTFGNLRPLSEILEPFDDLPPNLLFVPIFQTLLELPGVERFSRTITLHGTVDSENFKNQWSITSTADSVSTVIGNIGVFDDATREAQTLSESQVARNLKIFGKNQLGEVPDSIRLKTMIVGMLPRDEFMRQWLKSRLFIYWHRSNYHMHYTPLEAICAGMPILFSEENPLFRENLSLGLSREDLNELGACVDIEELEERVKILLEDSDKVLGLARAQKKLLTPFSRSNVLEEASALLKNVNVSRTDSGKSISPAMAAKALVPCAAVAEDFYKLRSGIAEKKGVELYLADFAASANFELRGPKPFEKILGEKHPQVALDPGEDYLRIIMGRPGESLAVSGLFQLKCTVFSLRRGVLEVIVEQWKNNKIIDHTAYYPRYGGAFNSVESFDLNIPENVDALGIHIKNLGQYRVFVKKLKFNKS
ncbi:MAG: hypothetical protein H6626_10985 [Pseudobdellovibrionaceae bacterium]|nr:MAG: hypothetical protein H6626_10985 [Pseudobdellovibrionaceae bacterium]